MFTTVKGVVIEFTTGSLTIEPGCRDDIFSFCISYITIGADVLREWMGRLLQSRASVSGAPPPELIVDLIHLEDLLTLRWSLSNLQVLEVDFHWVLEERVDGFLQVMSIPARRVSASTKWQCASLKCLMLKHAKNFDVNMLLHMLECRVDAAINEVAEASLAPPDKFWFHIVGPGSSVELEGGLLQSVETRLPVDEVNEGAKEIIEAGRKKGQYLRGRRTIEAKSFERGDYLYIPQTDPRAFGWPTRQPWASIPVLLSLFPNAPQCYK
ncbi:hypothetical protein FRB97_006310 [Tulasnella sp. 331]|nr:hypothetical protein FRB97_006310 [Tulasnella sp. 331]